MNTDTDNQGFNARQSFRLRELLDNLAIKQKDFANRINTDAGTIAKILSGKRQVGPNLEYKIFNEFNVNANWWNTGEGEMFNQPKTAVAGKVVDNDTLNYEELTYISTKARASFMELMDVSVEHETYWVLKSQPEESYKDQVVIEIGGDSMEPNYWDGCKVRCKVVPDGDWIYLNSGVYAVSYGNFFVVKRVKNSPVDGKIVLHSDNVDTGGSTEVPLSAIKRMWRVLRIVDAPAR